jgi:biopolymer transport protein ExbD
MFDNPLLEGSSLGGFGAPRRAAEDPHFDITAMIDLVFMMNIYFLVTFIAATSTEVDLPRVNNVVTLDADLATTITIVNGANWEAVNVFIGNRESGAPITDPAEQTRLVQEAIKQGVATGKTAVLVKAERSVRLRQLRRICAVANEEPNVTLHLAVLEKDEGQ